VSLRTSRQRGSADTGTVAACLAVVAAVAFFSYAPERWDGLPVWGKVGVVVGVIAVVVVGRRHDAANTWVKTPPSAEPPHEP
jgi:peptidoglycan/LPS O-acetylase OafA/YrhL